MSIGLYSVLCHATSCVDVLVYPSGVCYATSSADVCVLCTCLHSCANVTDTAAFATNEDEPLQCILLISSLDVSGISRSKLVASSSFLCSFFVVSRFVFQLAYLVCQLPVYRTFGHQAVESMTIWKNSISLTRWQYSLWTIFRFA